MLRKLIQTVLQSPYRWTAPWRRLPDFMLIGAQKSGTTSLFHYLCEHPAVLANPRERKEVYFFNESFDRGLNYYRQYFPLKFRKGLVGEGSTVYLHSPLVPERIQSTLPDMKFLVVLREPAARAVSHYYHHVQRGRETRAIDAAFSPDVLASFVDGSLGDGLSYRYLNNGCYASHLRRWLDRFDSSQFCILKAEDLYDNPQFVYDRACSFLGIDAVKLKSKSRILNEGIRREESTALQLRLRNMYASQVAELMDMNCINFSWSQYVA